MSPLHAPTNPGSDVHGTTLLLVSNNQGVVLAADSLAHLNTGRLCTSSQAKVFRVASHIVAGMAGPAGALDVKGDVLVDLGEAVPRLTAGLGWNRVDDDINRLKGSISTELHKVERIVMNVRNESVGAPTLFVFVAGYSRGCQFVRAIRFVGQFLQLPQGHVIRFEKGAVGRQEPPAMSTKASVVLTTRVTAVQDEAMALITGRQPVPAGYNGLSEFARKHGASDSANLPVSTLELFAHDVVKFTMERDQRIGGNIQVESVAAPNA